MGTTAREMSSAISNRDSQFAERGITNRFAFAGAVHLRTSKFPGQPLPVLGLLLSPREARNELPIDVLRSNRYTQAL